MRMKRLKSKSGLEKTLGRTVASEVLFGETFAWQENNKIVNPVAMRSQGRLRKIEERKLIDE